MSWSISFIGNPDKIVTALSENSAKVTGKSKEEYDAVLHHIIGLQELYKALCQLVELKLWEEKVESGNWALPDDSDLFEGYGELKPVAWANAKTLVEKHQNLIT
jgi:hypothetical protein